MFHSQPAVSPASDRPDPVDHLIRLSAEGNGALMRGDLAGYTAAIRMSDDFTIMAPFGGPVSHRAAFTPERMEGMAAFFRDGVFEQEVVQTYATERMVVLVLIERQEVRVGGLPRQDWPLRVTLVYTRKGEDWELAHRHADPLVEPISVEMAAALAAGRAAP